MFYRLSQKFLERQEDVPAEAKQVMYYSLAIGHHLGVIDCLTPVAECPVAEFSAWLETLPAGEGRSKFEGLLRWGEINIDVSHLAQVLPLLQGEGWTAALREACEAIRAEPAVYLIARRRA